MCDRPCCSSQNGNFYYLDLHRQSLPAMVQRKILSYSLVVFAVLCIFVSFNILNRQVFVFLPLSINFLCQLFCFFFFWPSVLLGCSYFFPFLTCKSSLFIRKNTFCHIFQVFFSVVTYDVSLQRKLGVCNNVRIQRMTARCVLDMVV